MPNSFDEDRKNFRDKVMKGFRIDDITPELRGNHKYGFYTKRNSNWIGTENGFYVYEEGNRPGLVLHKGFRYTLPPGQYQVSQNWQPDYIDLVFTDVDILKDPDEAFFGRLEIIIKSLTTT